MQLDEKWSFVGNKGKGRDRADEANWFRGDQWDHVAFDPDSRLVLTVVVDKRIVENVVLVLEDLKQRLDGRVPELVTSDEYPAYEEALLAIFGEERVPPPTGRPGRPRGPEIMPPAEMTYATVHKTRENGRVMQVETREVFGELADGATASTLNLERHNATDRKTRAQSCLQKDAGVTNAAADKP